MKDLKTPWAGNPGLEKEFLPWTLTLHRSELIKRLGAKACEYGGSTHGPLEVHHARKLKDVARGKALWQQMMAARHRKTLVRCIHCHHLLHAGRLPDREQRKVVVKGEPCAVKVACTVRRGGDG